MGTVGGGLHYGVLEEQVITRCRCVLLAVEAHNFRIAVLGLCHSVYAENYVKLESERERPTVQLRSRSERETTNKCLVATGTGF